MRRSIAAATVAASLAAVSVTGAVLAVPALGDAADRPAGPGWVQETLSGLVADGTITREQADAVASALDEARPAPAPAPGAGRGGLGVGRPLDASVVAGALGITEEEVRRELRDGRTVAELAQAHGVEVQAVIDAAVAAHRDRVADEVAAGELDQDELDQRLARVEQRAAALVERQVPGLGRAGGRGHGRPHQLDRVPRGED